MQDFDFALGETADMIRDTTRRFAADRIAPLAAADRRRGPLPARAVAGDGRARPARHHRRGGGWRARARLSRACRRAGGSQPRLGLGRPQLRRAFQSLRQPDPPLGESRAEGEISAQADLRRACRQPRHVGGGRGLGRRLDEAARATRSTAATCSTAPNSGSPTPPMPTRWSSMPRPAERIAAASPPS